MNSHSSVRSVRKLPLQTCHFWFVDLLNVKLFFFSNLLFCIIVGLYYLLFQFNSIQYLIFTNLDET